MNYSLEFLYYFRDPNLGSYETHGVGLGGRVAGDFQDGIIIYTYLKDTLIPWRSWAVLESFLEPLGLSWGPPGPAWRPLGPYWGSLGSSWERLKASWGRLGPSWEHLGPSWEPLGPSWERLGPP